MQSTAGRPQLMLAHFVAILLAVPTLVMFVLTLVGTVTAPLGIGILLVTLAVPTTQLLATGQRGLARVVLREPIEQQYRDTKGLGLITRVQRWAGDPARWRDVLWQLASVTIGFTLSVLTIALFAYPIWSIVWFGLWKGLPDIFDTPYGDALRVTTTSGAIAVSAGGFVLGVLIWWVTVKPIARWRFGLDAYLLGLSRREVLARRVQEVTTSRAQGADAAAAELRRVERDLHDGAQARLVALGMNLGLAAELIEKDPDAARQLLLEARDNSGVALQDIRSVVRGIHPPVLADRGLADAIRAVAVDLPIDFDLDLRPPQLPPRWNRPSISVSPNAWPTWASTRGRRPAGCVWRRTTGCCTSRSVTTVSAARTGAAAAYRGLRDGSRSSTARWRCRALPVGRPS
ncbi:sensor histidine kinase [Flexivirga alba]|uniref:histidine kinase n=1 Tax=Flexivirga alba TaxID=702742 RepID=A0ABW2AFH2_9MICO